MIDPRNEAAAKALFLRERKYHTFTSECPDPPDWEDLGETSWEHYRGNARAALGAARESAAIATVEDDAMQLWAALNPDHGFTVPSPGWIAVARKARAIYGVTE